LLNFLSSAPVQTALAVSAGAAVVSAMIGVFTIIRGQSFAGHALADISSAGGAGAYLVGVSPMLGFLGVAALGAGALEVLGVGRARERDLVTGIVLGAGLGVTALLLYLDVTTRSTSGAAVSVMFGSMFSIPPGVVAPALVIGAGAACAMAVIYRPLLLCSVAPELAAAAGLRSRLVGFLHLLVLALAVTLSAMTVGAILSTALLIGPAAAALRVTRRPGAAIAVAAGIGLASAWGGIWLAYDSYGWTPGRTWPVSFFIVSLIFAAYLLSGLRRRAV